MSPIKATGWLRERLLGEICISIAETPPPPPHTQTHTFTRAKNHARRLLTTSKGACGAGRDSKPLHLHHWRSRERWRTRDGLGEKKTSIRSAWTFLFLDIILSISLTFLGLSICPSRWLDFSCDSTERKRAKQGEKAGQISGEETSLYAERRTSLRASGVRLCAVGTQDRTGLPCSPPAA